VAKASSASSPSNSAVVGYCSSTDASLNVRFMLAPIREQAWVRCPDSSAEQVEAGPAVVTLEDEAATGLVGGRLSRLATLDAVRPGWPATAHAGAAFGVKAAEQVLVLAHQRYGVLRVPGG